MGDSESLPSNSPFGTYHCLCSNVVIATVHRLESLPQRAEPVQDGALILPASTTISASGDIDKVAVSTQSTTSALLNVLPDRRPIIVQREDGFEKRILLRCGRCNLVLGYAIDELHASSPIYLLPGGLIETSDMVKGMRPAAPPWAEQTG